MARRSIGTRAAGEVPATTKASLLIYQTVLAPSCKMKETNKGVDTHGIWNPATTTRGVLLLSHSLRHSLAAG